MMFTMIIVNIYIVTEPLLLLNNLKDQVRDSYVLKGEDIKELTNSVRQYKNC